MFKSLDPNVRRRQQPRTKTKHSPTEKSYRSSSERHQGAPKRPRQPQKQKQKALLLLTSLLALGVWYLTPVSDILTTLLLLQIPVEADVSIGKSALLEFPYRTIYHPTWTPLVKEIGKELVTTLEASQQSILQETSGISNWRGISGLFDELIMAHYHSDSNSATGFSWDFGVVEAPIVNAFALPGGIIRVTDKLLEKLSPTRGELAALLGHECGHAFHRHSQKRIIQQKMLHLVLSALTYEDGDDYDENFGEAIGELLIEGAKWFGELKYSRSDEYQADGTGWYLLLESNYYNPQSVQSLLTKLWTLNGKSLATLDWMSTHPATESRIETLKQKFEQLNRREQRRLQYRPI